MEVEVIFKMYFVTSRCQLEHGPSPRENGRSSPYPVLWYWSENWNSKIIRRHRSWL